MAAPMPEESGAESLVPRFWKEMTADQATGLAEKAIAAWNQRTAAQQSAQQQQRETAKVMAEHQRELRKLELQSAQQNQADARRHTTAILLCSTAMTAGLSGLALYWQQTQLVPVLITAWAGMMGGYGLGRGQSQSQLPPQQQPQITVKRLK